MFPIKDDNPTASRSIVVPALIAINIVVFLLVQPTFGSDRAQAEFVVCRAAIPYEVTHAETVLEAAQNLELPLGEKLSTDIAAFFEEQSCPRKSIWLSVLFSMFLHGGFFHIIGNMLFLWVFGNNIEDRLGKVKFAIFYVLCGAIATLAQSYLTPDSTITLIGASGAIAGVLGAYLLLFPRARVTSLVVLLVIITTIDLPAIVVLGIWFVLQLFSTIGSTTGDAGGVAYMAHVGGFVAGLVLVNLFRPRRRPPRIAVPYEPF